MSAYYDLYETPVPEGEEPKSLHARVCSKGTISGKEFMERVFREEHMPHAMVVGIVQAITTTLGDWLAKGYTVEIEGLGFFSTTLKCTHPVMNKKRSTCGVGQDVHGEIPSRHRIQTLCGR